MSRVLKAKAYVSGVLYQHSASDHKEIWVITMSDTFAEISSSVQKFLSNDIYLLFVS